MDYEEGCPKCGAEADVQVIDPKPNGLRTTWKCGTYTEGDEIVYEAPQCKNNQLAHKDKENVRLRKELEVSKTEADRRTREVELCFGVQSRLKTEIATANKDGRRAMAKDVSEWLKAQEDVDAKVVEKVEPCKTCGGNPRGLLHKSGGWVTCTDCQGKNDKQICDKYLEILKRHKWPKPKFRKSSIYGEPSPCEMTIAPGMTGQWRRVFRMDGEVRVRDEDRKLYDHEAVALILRDVQDKLDEAGVDICQDSDGRWFASIHNYGDDPGWLFRLLRNGKWVAHETPTKFSCRVSVMLAAFDNVIGKKK